MFNKRNREEKIEKNPDFSQGGVIFIQENFLSCQEKSLFA